MKRNKMRVKNRGNFMGVIEVKKKEPKNTFCSVIC